MVSGFRREAKEEYDRLQSLCEQCRQRLQSQNLRDLQAQKDYQLCVVDLVAESALAMYFLQRIEVELDAWYRESGTSSDSRGVENLKKDIRNMYYALRGINESFIDIDVMLRFRMSLVS